MTGSDSPFVDPNDPFSGAPPIPPDRPPGEETVRPPEAPAPHAGEGIPAHETAVIGVSGAGKSFLLAALQQACILSGSKGYQFSFIPKLNQSAEAQSGAFLIREAVDRIVTGNKAQLKATLVVTRYSFELECRASWYREPTWHGRPQQLSMTVVDGPGTSLFPEMTYEAGVSNLGERVEALATGREYERMMLESVQRAENLVICVDSAKPRLSLFRKEFSSLIERVSKGRRGGFTAKRVLLLFTKIDAAVDAGLQGAHRAYRELLADEEPTIALRLLKNNAVTPLRLAQLIDPLDFARATLDQASLSLVRRALDPAAEMGVGVCSSTGFYAEGSSFWDERQNDIRVRRGQTPDDRLRNWMPFGVEEAILFLMTGRTSPVVCGYSAREDQVAAKERAPRRLRLKFTRDEEETLMGSV